MSPAPDPSAELVQLREAVALGRLDQHHGALGTSMPTSITLVATSTSASPAANERHRRLLLAGSASGRGSARREVGELGGGEPLGLGRRGRRLKRLGLLDQRADDEHLATRPRSPRGLARRPAPAPVRRRPRRSRPGCRPFGSSRSTVTSRSPNAVSASVRGIGVAVMWSTCGARPLRGLGVERGALPDAEAVLLVDHADGERPEHDSGPRSARGCRRPAPARRSRAGRASGGAGPPASTP